MRDLILNMAGGMLIYLQLVETEIKLTCAVLPADTRLTLTDFLSDDPGRRRRTLGQLTVSFKKIGLFRSEFEERLTSFVTRRNRYIHSLLVEAWGSRSQPSGLPSEPEQRRIHDFIRELATDATYIRNVFRGLLYELMPEQIRGSDKPDEAEPFISWTRYIPMFRAEVRGQSQDDST